MSPTVAAANTICLIDLSIGLNRRREAEETRIVHTPVKDAHYSNLVRLQIVAIEQEVISNDDHSEFVEENPAASGEAGQSLGRAPDGVGIRGCRTRVQRLKIRSECIEVIQRLIEPDDLSGLIVTERRR